jgi:hypothetical protein
VAVALPSEKENFTGFGRENPKQGGRLVFIFGRDRENLGL